MENRLHPCGGGDGDYSLTAYVSTYSRNSSTTNMNKLSHKIFKPIRGRSLPTVDLRRLNPKHSNEVVVVESQPMSIQRKQLQQTQVYTINRRDFREVVQRLTGSTTHERARSPAQPAQEPVLHVSKLRPYTARLHKVRPPPLAEVSKTPPNMLNYATGQSLFLGGQNGRLLSRPPVPTVQVAAPFSSYMRFFQNSFGPFPTWPLASPRHNTVGPPPPPPPHHNLHQPLASASPPQPEHTDPPLTGSPSPPPSPPHNSPHQPLFSASPPPQPGYNPDQPLTGAPSPPPLPPPENIPSPEHTPDPPLTEHPPPLPYFPSSPLPFGFSSSPGMFSPSGVLSPDQLGVPPGFSHQPLSPTLPIPSPTWKWHY